VPGGACKPARSRPAAVAVHDDGDVQISVARESTLHCKVSNEKNFNA
jgi:hypothetical protein